ncbi:hypothetical protein [Burkholderia multivorans]|nr:hypothetical protein [Burkholderia multivorans]
MTVTTFRTGEEALAIADGTACRLCAGLFTQPAARTRLRAI